jgi:membrane fusion protein, multidrug efflux system
MTIQLIRAGFSVLRAAPLAMFAVSVLGACHRQEPAAAAPAIVVAAPVSAPGGSADETIRYPVEAAARYSNVMSFRVAGKLIERNVRLGDAVHKGQVIARLDAVDAQKQAVSAEAAFDAAEHRLAFAKQQLDRDQAQFAQNLIAANQLEQTQDAYAAALAGREESAAQRVVAQNTLQYNTLSADHDGVITSENADTGQVVSAGQAVYGLAWSGDTDVVLDAAAGDLGRIAVGQTASIAFPAVPGRRFEAHVREVAPAADPQSRTYRVKLTLMHPGAAVRLGMTGDAELSPASAGGSTSGEWTTGDTTTGGPSAAGPTTPGPATANPVAGAPGTFSIPATAIFHNGSRPAVWVIRANDSTLELRPVTVRSYGERSAVVTQGLRDGDSIVLAGVHTVFAGEHVKPVKPLFAGEDENDAGPKAATNQSGATNAARSSANGGAAP